MQNLSREMQNHLFARAKDAKNADACEPKEKGRDEAFRMKPRSGRGCYVHRKSETCPCMWMYCCILHRRDPQKTKYTVDAKYSAEQGHAFVRGQSIDCPLACPPLDFLDGFSSALRFQESNPRGRSPSSRCARACNSHSSFTSIPSG